MKLDRQQVNDLLVGAKIMGTGGGGEVDWALPLIDEVCDRGKEFVLCDPNEVADDELVVIVSEVGGGVSEEMKKKVEGYSRIKERPVFVAFQELGRYIGKEPSAILPAELGAGNTLAAMYVAAMLGKVTIDADGAGRAKPELSISTTNIKHVPVTPLCSVTEFGDILFIDKVVDDRRAEDLARAVANASGGISGVCRCPMKGKVMREAVVPNTVTKAIAIGKAIREATAKGKDPVEALLKEVNGVEMFKGKVASFNREERAAFVWGDFTIAGSGKYQGHDLKVAYKNEHLVSWLDGEPYVTCPDAICIVDSKGAQGLSNWSNDFQRDREVTVFGVRAHPLWRTERGLQLFGPRHFGYDVPYVPLERQVSK